jgi:hypothetical protein
MIQTPRIDYRARGDATTESQASALANVYRFLIHSSSKRGRLLDKSGPRDAILQNTKGGSHVDQRPG